MTELFKRLEYRFYAVLSLLTFLNTLLFIAPQTSSLTLLVTGLGNKVFYTGFLILGGATLGTIAFFFKKFNWKTWLLHALLVWLPAMVVLTYGLSESHNFHYVFIFGIGIYIILAGILITGTFITEHPLTKPDSGLLSFRGWWESQGKVPLTIVILATLIFFSCGLFRLTEYAAVDEPLWLDGRIHRYWKNIGEHDWKGTNISDKPGITVALATGIGTLFKHSSEFKTVHFQGEVFNLKNGVEDYYFAFRFPFLVTITLLLPLFYFFSERLFGRKTALFIYVLLATSPILVGISKIINPDGLLWIFTPLSLLSYLLFRKQQAYRYLILSGILLGLALLTKYIANILFVFFLGLVFLEYLFHDALHTHSITQYFKRSFQYLGMLTFTALTTFYLLLPATWLKPEKLLKSTIFSQAFEKVAPLFLFILAFIFLDQWLNRARLVSAFLTWLEKWKRVLVIALIGVFFLSSLVVLINTWLGMPWYTFPELLASPKTIATKSDFLGVFLTNFYPLLFGIPPVMLFLLLGSIPFFLVRKSFPGNSPLLIAWYCLIFIFLYYLGATVNGVASIVRYQIIIFPMVAIIAGITLGEITTFLEHRFKVKNEHTFYSILLIVFGLGSLSLITTPYPLSYASSLLPKAYHIDVKDMGAGSYEAAQWLNSLPGAQDMLVWTDKDGVCKFFIGRCKRGLSYEKLRAEGLDYIIVSAGRESRTTKMMAGDVLTKKPGLIRFDEYYRYTAPTYEIDINGRSSHFIKIFSFPGGNTQP